MKNLTSFALFGQFNVQLEKRNMETNEQKSRKMQSIQFVNSFLNNLQDHNGPQSRVKWLVENHLKISEIRLTQTFKFIIQTNV